MRKKNKPSLLVKQYTIVKNYLELSNKQLLLLFSTLFFSFFLRFINYENRWGLAYDQARDTIVTHVAYATSQLPLIGPFSASGPFVFGPYWYWVHTFFTALNPFTVNWLWITQTFISSLIPFVFFIIGKKTVNPKFGLLVAFLTSISTAQIAQSTNLTYSSFVGFISVVILLGAVLAIQTKKKKYIFLTSLLIGLSMNIHFQAVGMVFMLPLLLFFSRFTLSNFFLSFIAFMIPFIPLVYFDLITDHFQSKHILDYLFSRGDGGALQKRWLTYVGEYWPNALGHIIGGYSFSGFFLGILTVTILFFSYIKKKIPRIILFSVIFLFINFIVLRYFKGNVFDSFLVYMHPVIFIVIGWVLFRILVFNKYVGIAVIAIVTVLTFFKNYQEIFVATNATSQLANTFMVEASGKYATEKFSFYDYNLKYTDKSFPTVMYFMKNDLIDDNGYKLGIAFATSSAEIKMHNADVISGQEGGYILFDLNNQSRKELEDKGWAFVNPSIIYDSVVNWYKDGEY